MRKVTVVGVGALGSHVVQLLRSVKDITLFVIDFDRVEQKNVMSQFHGKPSVGKLKTQALQQTMNFLFGMKIDVASHKLTKDNAKELLGGADLIVDCLDNAEARRIVQEFARATETPCLHGALDANGSFGRVIWDAGFVIDEETEGQATCEDGEHLPFIALTGAFLAKAAQEFLTAGRQLGFSIHPGGAVRS